MRFRQLLDTLYEAPIEDYQTIGDFDKRYSMRHRTDRRLLTNPRYVERIKQMFRNTEVNFRMFMVNNREAWVGSGEKDEYGQRYEPYQEQGEVSLAWLEEKMPETSAQIQQQGGFTGDAINIIYTNNNGTERRPMTGWLLAHRASHALTRQQSGMRDRYGPSNFNSVLRAEVERTLTYLFQLYNTQLPRNKVYPGNYSTPTVNFDASMIVNSLLPQIGTFKSARDKNLRDTGEFIHECFAQYLLNGAVRFNNPTEPMVARYNWGRPEHRGRLQGHVETTETEGAVQNLAGFMENEFSRMLHMSVGKIFVM